MNLDLIKIEEMEYHYFREIKFMLEQENAKMLNGLFSKEDIKEDWEDVFSRSDKKKKNSDFARGAERIYYWLFNQIGKPNSTPIGSDMMFETYNAYIHIDIKTAKKSNTSDFKGKVNVGENQTSYKDNSFNSNLPNFYTKKNGDKVEKKMCLTYIILVIYDDETFEILSIMLICIPNGELNTVYKHDIVDAGKSKESSFRFKYNCKFELLNNSEFRYSFIYLNSKISKDDIVS